MQQVKSKSQSCGRKRKIILYFSTKEPNFEAWKWMQIFRLGSNKQRTRRWSEWRLLMLSPEKRGVQTVWTKSLVKTFLRDDLHHCQSYYCNLDFVHSFARGVSWQDNKWRVSVNCVLQQFSAEVPYWPQTKDNSIVSRYFWTVPLFL